MTARSLFVRTMSGAAISVVLATPGLAEDICRGYGPQSPRDIGVHEGRNGVVSGEAPDAGVMNLCNIHTHTNAEHKGPGFSVYAGEGEKGGYRCNGSDALSAAELAPTAEGRRAFEGAEPGDTIEVHWVYTSCDVPPGEGLGACSSGTCSNPTLRVEAQVFLLVNDAKALDFADFDYQGRRMGGHYQPKALPSGTGKPVVYSGSTTGPDYSQAICSPAQVTWSVRPQCAKLDINSLERWAENGNVFGEYHSHGVRPLVRTPDLLSQIKEEVVKEARWDDPLATP
ncbi:delta-class carbonic anhydrase [Aurantimonas sp. VKM B-3413]|uniref:delta-class carbonic anhydrase n=1 Tax=Aurantimonas sp. VKM B-3413 TaxID=2779401 RepID=UPI001E5A9AF7|nr:delta-class carbonic anhydrase [Aurantimonas sp. VKM B-3413]MCB8839236.1 cadmium carbonic anhydrase [Aurantimonas sp. VKM B-3413]